MEPLSASALDWAKSDNFRPDKHGDSLRRKEGGREGGAEEGRPTVEKEALRLHRGEQGFADLHYRVVIKESHRF